MVRHKHTVTRKERTTDTEARTESHGIAESDPVYWEIVDGVARVTTEEPRFFRWFGAIKVGQGSTVEDVRKARALRGR
ncbi:MAG: hypothetical protein ACXW5U_21790 [Thermoanaerobaculia bacterium]